MRKAGGLQGSGFKLQVAVMQAYTERFSQESGERYSWLEDFLTTAANLAIAPSYYCKFAVAAG